MNVKMQSLLIGLTLLLGYCDGLVVPGEVFSLLSSAIQTIPKFIKGTDSRFGIGYRFGEHADFQTIIELGPQKFTKPLGKVAIDDSEKSDTSKRMVNLSKNNKVVKPTYEKKGQWIQNWVKEMKIKTTNQAQKPQIANNDSFESLFGPKDQYPIPTSSVIINTPALGQLQPFDSKNKEQSNETANRANEMLPSHLMEVNVLMASKIKEQQQIRSDLMDVSLEN